MGKYAILLSGGINFQGNFARYKNDLEFVYKVLVEDGNFQEKDIQVLFANAKELEYGGEKIITQEASLNNLRNSLQEMSRRLEEDDVFLLVVTNHGGTEKGGCINLWGTEVFSLKELADEMTQIKAQKILILGECYAGNFLQYDVDNACIITANMSGMLSFANPNNPEYDEFLYHFFAYIHEGYPDGISIKGKSENDVCKAFQYAVDMDALSPNNPVGDRIRALYGPNYVEIPQMKCNIVGKLSL